MDEPRDRAPGAPRILITRSAGHTAELPQALAALGARVEERPTIELRPPRSSDPPQESLARLATYDWILFTSPNGVRFFCELANQTLDGRRPPAAVAAIGQATAAALAAHGIDVAFTAARSDSEGFASELRGRISPGERVLIVRPEQAREVLPRALREIGARVDSVPFYRNVPAPDVAAIAREVGDRRYAVIVFSSPSTWRRLVDAGESAGIGIFAALREIALVAIGDVTATAIRRDGFEPAAVAGRPETQSIVDAVAPLLAP